MSSLSVRRHRTLTKQRSDLVLLLHSKLIGYASAFISIVFKSQNSNFSTGAQNGKPSVAIFNPSYILLFNQNFNLQRQTSNYVIQHSNKKIQHSTIKIQHSTKKFNIQPKDSTFNQKISTFNQKIQHSTKKFNNQPKNSTFNQKHSTN